MKHDPACERWMRLFCSEWGRWCWRSWYIVGRLVWGGGRGGYKSFSSQLSRWMMVVMYESGLVMLVGVRVQGIWPSRCWIADMYTWRQSFFGGPKSIFGWPQKDQIKAIGHVEIQDQIEATRYPKILPLDFKIKANCHPKPAGISTSPREEKIR